MASIPVEHGLLLAGVLFSIGLMGLIVRRNVLMMLLCVEIMLNSAGLAFVTAGAALRKPDGQIMMVFILTMAAAEVAVGLALIIQFFHSFRTLDVDAADKMRG